MTFEIDVNGRTRSVSIERTGNHDRFRVTVDGKTTLVDVQRSSDYGLSLLFPEKEAVVTVMRRGKTIAVRYLPASSAPKREGFQWVRVRDVPDDRCADPPSAP